MVKNIYDDIAYNVFLDYMAINHVKSVLLPEEGSYITFQNFKRLTKSLSIIYGDFKYVLVPSIDNIDFGPRTKKYQDHNVCSSGYKLMCS